MTNREAIKILRTERECVRRNWKENCDRNCGECDLVMDAEQIMEAYDMAITALEKQEPKGAIISTWFGRQCPECRCSVDEDDDYCPYCGQRLTDKEKTDAED